ncbi:hypothetical protein CHUAL_007211 [Chamberlinius hualienensis]
MSFTEGGEKHLEEIEMKANVDGTEIEKFDVIAWGIWGEKVKYFMSKISVEPIVFFATVSHTMQSVIVQSLVFDQSCLVTLGLPDQQHCYNNTTTLQQLEGTVSDFIVYIDIITKIPFIFMAPFLGPFCDIHGPKLLLVTSLISHVLSELVFIIISIIFYIRPEFSLIGHAVKGLSGSFRTFFLGIDTYIVVSSSVKTRTTRMALLEVAYLLGSPIGSLLGGLIYHQQNYAVVFIISFLINSVALLWTLVLFRSSPYIVTGKQTALKQTMKWKSIFEGLKVFTKRRPSRKQFYLILSIICTKLLQLPPNGDNTMLYPFAQLKFDFQVKNFSIYQAYVMGLNCFGALVVIPLLSYILKISDITLVLAAVIFNIIGELSMALSPTVIWFYLGSTFLLFSTPSHVLGRAIMSKCVDKDEQGKLLSTYALLIAGIPMLVAFAYNRLFHATIDSFPAAPLVVSSVIYLFPFVGFLWMYVDMKFHYSDMKYSVLDAEHEMQDIM